MSVLEKTRLSKLLDGLEVPEVRLSEKCVSLVEEFREEVTEDLPEREAYVNVEEHSNPFIPNRTELEEIDKKILKLTNTTLLKQVISSISSMSEDPKRPWRIHTNKEKLLRIDNELKRHHERSNDLVSPLPVEELATLLLNEDKSIPVEPERISVSVESAKKSLPNFQYSATADKTRMRRYSETAILKDSQGEILCNDDIEMSSILLGDDSVLKKSCDDLEISVSANAIMAKITGLCGVSCNSDIDVIACPPEV